MQGSLVLENYMKKRLSFYKWRSQLAFAYKLLFAVSMAGVTGVLAQVKFYLPWTPVPIVAAQIGVILAAVMLGSRWGGISMAIYALGGFAGISWFAGYTGGLAVLFGPTGGYIFGYVLAAFFIGHMVDTNVNNRKFLPFIGLTIFAQLIIVYVPGLIQLGLWLNFVQGDAFNIYNLLWMGCIPFVIGDIFKSIIIAGTVKLLLPMEKYK